MIAPDETTYSYMQGREFAPKGAEWDKKQPEWKQLYSDKDAAIPFKEITIDAADIEPQGHLRHQPRNGRRDCDGQIPASAKILRPSPTWACRPTPP